MRSITVITPPADPVVTTAEAKLHLRVDGTDEDTYIGILVAAATKFVERTYGLAIMEQTIRETFDCWECVEGVDGVYLDRSGPNGVEAIVEIEIQTVEPDLGGSPDPLAEPVSLTANSFQTDLLSRPARISAPAGGTLIAPYAGVLGAIRISYTAGEPDAGDVPEEIKQGILMLVGDLYENRSNEITGTIVSRVQNGLDMLLANWKLHTRS